MQTNISLQTSLCEELSDSFIGMLISERSETGESVTGGLCAEVSKPIFCASFIANASASASLSQHSQCHL
jgi:hypothetical protein